MANVVAVTDVGELQTFERAEFFFECEEIGERLTGMEFVGESVDDGNFRGGGHLVEDPLFVNASDDAVNPALEIASDIGDGFAFAEASLGVIKKNDVAGHALNSDLESDASTQRRFFEDERDKFSAQRVGITGGIGLDVRRDREKFSRMRRTPFGSGEQIVCDKDWSCQSSCCHFFLLPHCGVSRVPRRFRRSHGFRNVTQNLFEDREKFANLFGADDEGGEEAQSEFVRAVEE